jgi:hypothetical protein
MVRFSKIRILTASFSVERQITLWRDSLSGLARPVGVSVAPDGLAFRRCNYFQKNWFYRPFRRPLRQITVWATLSFVKNNFLWGIRAKISAYLRI